MIVWALDLATNTGECWGEPGASPSLGHNRLPSTGDDVGRFLSEFRKWFMGRLDEVCPTLVSFEAPILPAATSMSTVRKLNGLAGVTEMLCHEEGIECCEATTTAVKKALTGSGGAKKWQMVEACRAYGLGPHTYNSEGREASDEADAFGVWLATVRARCPTHADLWKPLVFGRRL